MALASLMIIACPTTDEPGQVLNMKITAKNDSLLTFDSLVVTVHSKDGKFSQVVFHGVLRDPKQVASMSLDPRVGADYTVSIVGYRGGYIGFNKEVTFIGSGAQSMDLPIHQEKPETVVVFPNLPDILVPADTSIVEGDSLRFRVSIHNTWNGPTKLTLREVIPGAALDTVGRDPGDGYFTWRPSFEQGRTEPYAVTFVYASLDKKVEKITRVKVLNLNRPPKLAAIPDQKANENEILSFKISASDPDHDSITLTASGLPYGSAFSSGLFTWKPVVGQVGNYSVKFLALDGVDSDFVSVLISVGNVNVPPLVVVKIISPANDISINYTPVTVQYTVNGSPFQRTFSLKDGKNRIRIDTTVQSRAGFDTLLITLDTIPPGRPTVSGTTPVRTRTPAWNWSSGLNGAGLFRFRLDNPDLSTALATSETNFIPATDQAPGTHTLFVQERDVAGNWSQSGIRAIRIDTTRPAAPQLTVTAPSPTNNPFPTWNWSGSGDDLTGLFRYKLDAYDFQSGGVETRLTFFTPAKDQGLKEGVHYLYVQQQDSAGNWSNTGSLPIIIDLTAPAKPNVSAAQPSPTNNTRPTWMLTSGAGGMGFYRVMLDDSNMTRTVKSGSFTSFTPDSALAHGLHTLFAQERDSAGNWSAIRSSGLVVDLIPPAVPLFDVTPLSPLSSLQPSWTWKSGGGGMSIYRCKLDDSLLAQNSDTNKIGTFKPATVLNEGLHILYVQERDTAGNWSATSSRELVLSIRKILGKAGFSSNPVFMTSIAVSKTGVPYVAYRDDANGGKATVMRFNGTAWEFVGAAGFSAGVVEFITLRINDAGIPYVTYQDKANGDRISVMRFILDSWGYVGSAGFSNGATSYNSLALSRSGMPYVAFWDGSQSGKMTVMRSGSTGWETVGPAGFSTGTVMPDHISLGLSASDVPYIAFVNQVNWNKALTVMRLNGGAWENVGSDGILASNGYNPSLAITGETPYVAFEDNANGDKATVSRFVLGKWQNVGSGPVSVLGGLMPSLAMSVSGIPYLAFQDAANGEKATVMRFNGTAWEAVGGFGITAGAMTYPSLAVNGLGVPFLSCQDGANGNMLTVLKTAFEP